MNRCGLSNKSPDAQCCAGPHVNCQNGNAVSCNDYCDSGFATCRGNDFSFGCPFNLNSDVNNCSFCGNVCPHVNGTAVCTSGRCSTICSPGYRQCNPSV